MKRLDLTVFEPGETVGTLSADGSVMLWQVTDGGTLVAADRRLMFPDDAQIEVLGLSVRAYNVLKREGVNTVGELLAFYRKHGDEGLDEVRNIGHAAQEIRTAVAKLRRAPV